MTISPRLSLAVSVEDAATSNPYRNLWIAIAEGALHDFHKVIVAARNGKRSVYLDGSSRYSVRSLAIEEAAARRYFDSDDWQEVAANAGIDADTDCLMAVVRRVMPRTLRIHAIGRLK